MRYYSSTAGQMILQAGITPSDTTIVVDTVAGLPLAYPYTLTVDYGTATEEVVDVTAAAATTLTVVRGRDGTIAQSHAYGAKVRHVMTARDLRESRDHEAATGAHGVGTVAGLTETQTMEGKTFLPSTDTRSVAFRARASQTNPHVEMQDSGGNVVARWYEGLLELISGATSYAKLRYGGGPAIFKNILELRVGNDIHAIVGAAVSGATGKFLRLLNPSSVEVFSVDAAGAVTASSVTTANAVTAGSVSATSLSAGSAAVSGNATVGGTLGVTGALTSPTITTIQGNVATNTSDIAGHTSTLSNHEGRIAAAEGQLARTPYATSVGQVTGFSAGSHASGAVVTSAVSFPVGRFTQAPRVMTNLSAAPSGSAFLSVRAISVTTSGFTIALYNTGTTTAAYTGVSVDWVAEQMTSSNANG